MALVGAIEEARKTKLLEDEIVQGYAGSSSGSIVAALVAAGLTGPEMRHAVSTLLSGSAGSSLSPKLNLAALNKLTYSFGLSSGDDITAAVDEILFDKLGIRNITFAQLKEKTGKVGSLFSLFLSPSSLSP